MNSEVDINVYVLLGYNNLTKKMIPQIYKNSRQRSFVVDFIPRIHLTKIRHFEYLRITETNHDDILVMSISCVFERIDEEKHIVLVPCNKLFYDFTIRNKERLECLCVLNTDYFKSERIISNDTV